VPPKEQCKTLTAKVSTKDDGTAGLGPKDGGVYDWIGRATEKEFVGFYTNA